MSNHGKYGQLVANDDGIDMESLDEYSSDSDISETGTDKDYRIQLDDGQSPYTKHRRNITIPDTDTLRALNQKRLEQSQQAGNDQTPLQINHHHSANGYHAGYATTTSNDDSIDEDNHVIEIGPDGNARKNGYHRTGNYHRKNRSKMYEEGLHILLSKLLKYKSGALKQYLIPQFLLFKFKRRKHDKSFPIYADKQYHTIHWVCILLMIFEVAILHFVHNDYPVLDTLHQGGTVPEINLDLIVSASFIGTLVILLIYVSIDSFLLHCIPSFRKSKSSDSDNNHSMKSNRCFNRFCSDHSTTAFTLSIGIVLLFLIILYTICGGVTTDRFILYFVVTLGFNSCLGYIKTVQYVLLSFIVTAEFLLCAVLRWQGVISVGTKYTNGNGDDIQSEGVITEAEYCFAAGIIIFSLFYNGIHVYRMQKTLSLEYIEGLQINEYVETGKIKFSKEVDEIWGVSQQKQIEMTAISGSTSTKDHSQSVPNGDHDDQQSEHVNSVKKQQNGFHAMLGLSFTNNEQSINPMHPEISSSNGMSGNKSVNPNSQNRNGRSHDLGALDPHSGVSGLHQVSKALPVAMMRRAGSSSTYSDEEELSKLSSLQHKVDQQIEAEILESEEEDSDIDSSSLESVDPYQPAEPPAIDVGGSSINYSLSTTFTGIGTPRTVDPVPTQNQNARNSFKQNTGNLTEDHLEFIGDEYEKDTNTNSNSNKNLRVDEMDIDQFVDLLCDHIDCHDVEYDKSTLTSTMQRDGYSGMRFVETLNTSNAGILFTKSLQQCDIRLGVAMTIYKNIKHRVEEEAIEPEPEAQEPSVSTFHDEKFNVLSLIATCKFVAQKAGNAITEIYHVVDQFDNVQYDETRSFEEIDRHWIDNRKKLAMAHQASERGMKRKKKRKRNTVSDTASLASSDGGAPSSPFKQKLPAYIKETELFQLTPNIAAMSLSNAIISDSIKAHFPELNGVKFPNETRKLDREVALPQWIEVDGAKRRKLSDENGNDIERELRRREPLKLESFRNLEEENLVVWVQPMEGIKAMTKRDRESQRSVTIMIGISDVDTKRPIAGIIHRPFTKETVVGIPNLGVWPFDFRVIGLGSKSKSKRIVINRYNHGDVVKKYLKKIKYDQLTLEGGLGNNVLLLMENEADAVLHPDHERTHKWDTCAIEAVILALGGDFTQINGKEYEYSGVTNRLKKGFIATLQGTKYHQQYQYDLYFA